MTMTSPKKYKLDEFEFSFNKKDRGLFLQAEHQSDSKTFSKFISRRAAETLSRDHSLNIDTLFQLLEDYFTNKPDKVSLALSNSGFLYYSCQIILGNLPKQFDFNLKLDNNSIRSSNQNVNILDRVERRFQDIASRLSNLESREYSSSINFGDLSSKSTAAQSFQNIDSYSSVAEQPQSIQSLISNISARFESIKSDNYSTQSIENNYQNPKQKEDSVTLDSREYLSINDLSTKFTAQNVDFHSSVPQPRSVQSLLSNISARFESVKSDNYSTYKNPYTQIIENNYRPPKQKEDPVQAQLRSKLGKIQERFSRFDNRLSTLEKRPTLIGDDIEVIVCKFTTFGPFSKSYNFDNDCRTAAAKFTQPACIASEKPLPKHGKYKFAFLIDSADFIMVGVTNTEGREDRNCFSEKQTFAYEGEGRIWREGKASEKIFRGYAKGDIISFVVDCDTGIIDVFLNRSHTLRHRISEEYLKDQDLYPFLHTDINEGCCATFI